MPEDFQQTVDLRERAEKRRQPARPAGEPAPKPAATPLEKIYQDQGSGGPEKDWQKISQPRAGRQYDGLIKLIVFRLAGLVVGTTAYFLFFRAKSDGPETLNRDWYAVKLVDSMVYYGQILNLKTVPVTIVNVYYDYDRDKAIKERKAFVETGNIRLVKLGKETQGGDGSIIVYPANGWPIMEPLRADSKVLQAILEYEK